jgi:acyl-coenzyme A thioesterase PaaI-like protein
MFALADVAACLASLARIGPVALAVTTGATIDFLRKPAPHSDLRAEARVLDLGRVLAVALICSAGMAGQVARASLTCSVPPPRLGLAISAWRA